MFFISIDPKHRSNVITIQATKPSVLVSTISSLALAIFNQFFMASFGIIIVFGPLVIIIIFSVFAYGKDGFSIQRFTWVVLVLLVDVIHLSWAWFG